MHTRVSLNPRALKMSVCSEFVEHVWKPGSCKNCFHPRGSHGLLQGPSEVRTGGGGQALLHGILRNKSETLHEDDGGVTVSPYSKPTIAVKPTMISSEVADAWSESAMAAEGIPQVSWRKISSKHPVLKTEEVHRTFFERFGSSREPFNHVATSPGALQHAPGYTTLGLHSPDRKVERNLSSGSRKGTGHDDKAHFLCKEKVTSTQGAFTQETTISTETRAGFTTDSADYLCVQAREDGIFSVSAKNGCSTSFQADGGDYCQIATYTTDRNVAHEASAVEGRRTWHDGTGPAMGPCIQNFLANSRANGKSSKENTLMNSQLGHEEDHCVLEKLQNRAGSSWKKTASLPQLSNWSGVSACASTIESPLASSPQEGDYYRLSGELEPQAVQERHVKNQRNLQSSIVAEPAQTCKDEPIYAESTKRKKVFKESAKSEGPSNHCGPKQGNDACGDRALYCNSNQAVQETSTQVTAKITVMAAHTEEDNRTIYLSSPDSAVSIQWSCISPASNQEFGTLSPSFHCLEGSHGMKEPGRGEKPQVYHTPAASKSPVRGTPSMPPKMLECGKPPCEQSDAVFDSLAIHAFCGSSKPEAASALPPSRNTHGTSAFRNSSTRSPQSSTAEEQDKSLSPLATERRHKYYTAAWSRQGRIEEEEEEEVLSHQTKAPAGEPRSPSSTHTSENPIPGRAGRFAMSKSASCPYEFARDRVDSEEIPAPPPPPPKRHLRPVPKKSKNHCEPEQQRVGSASSLTSPSHALNVSFITSSTDSLSSTRTCSDGGQSNEGIHLHVPPHDMKKPVTSLPSAASSNDDTPCAQPPPLPQKKTTGRTTSAPENACWDRAFLGHRILSPTSRRMNTSQSETNVFHHETGQVSCPSSPADSQHLFSSCESLEKFCRGHGHRTETRSGPCLHSQASNSLSSSQLNMSSSHVPSGSSLQLHHLLSNIDSKEGMYAKLGGLYAESLRRLVAKCEDCFMQDQKTEHSFNENSWSLFKLTSNKACCDSGDAIYYCATCAKDTQMMYAVKICKPEDSKTPSYCSLSLPVHFNIQQDCGHFLATVPSSMSQSTKTLNGSSAPNGALQAHAGSEQECVVVITREVPHQTAADFVKDSLSAHSARPEVHERQVCFLLLQLCNGLEHLKEHGIIHRDLCLENLLFAHCQSSAAGKSTQNETRLPRLIISNFSKAKQRSGAINSKLKRDQARLAPEIVSASQYKKFDEFQTGILIYELLHQPNPFEVRQHLREQEYSQDDLPSVPHLSLYSKGLQRLAYLLLEADPIKRIRITEAKRVLQCLLWGPRKDLADQPFNHEEALHSALQNWIDMKRALLMMKFAERAVDPEKGIELEDWLCCQYLASTDPCLLYHTLRLLHLL